MCITLLCIIAWLVKDTCNSQYYEEATVTMYRE